MVRKRRKLGKPLSFARAVMQQMEAVRARGPAENDPKIDHKPAAATFTATQEQVEQTVEGEMAGEQWVKEIQLRTQHYFQHLSGYLRSQGSSILSTLSNQYCIASYWDAEAKGEGGEAFQLDSHLCSEATGNLHPTTCPYCNKQPPTPKWTRAQHLEKTAHSMGFFDRADHKLAITTALQQGQLEQVMSSFWDNAQHGTKDQLQVTGSTWRQWCKEADEQAAARKEGMMGSGFVSVLQAARAKVHWQRWQRCGARGSGAGQASGSAQRAGSSCQACAPGSGYGLPLAEAGSFAGIHAGRACLQHEC
eukprot:1155069-Pelagomonas_calceolata.AAC.2